MMKLKILIGIVGISCVTAQTYSQYEIDQWEMFKVRCHRRYDKNEDINRMKIFAENLAKVDRHNVKYQARQVSYKVKITCSGSDWTKNEYKILMHGYLVGFNKTGKAFMDDGSRAPGSVDWREKGAVSPVREQGLCAAAWAFTAVDTLQDHYFIKTGKGLRLSAQELLDCSHYCENLGCDGGRIDSSFKYVLEHGISTEAAYPFVGEDRNCMRSNKTTALSISGHMDIPEGNETALAKAVSMYGPIAASVDASNWSFQHYSYGIYIESECSAYDINMAVQIAGYGTENGQDYWIVKSALGTDWGDDGYIKIARNAHNQCGVATDSSFPNLII